MRTVLLSAAIAVFLTSSALAQEEQLLHPFPPAEEIGSSEPDPLLWQAEPVRRPRRALPWQQTRTAASPMSVAGSAPAAFGEGFEAQTNAYRRIDLGGWQVNIVDVQPMADGGVMLAGRAETPPLEFESGYEATNPLALVLLRLTADGTPDPAFGSEGRVVAFPETVSGKNLASLLVGGAAVVENAVLVTGYARTDEGRTEAFVMRYSLDGTLDSAFGNGGYVGVPRIDNQGTSAYDIAIQPDGKIVLAGNVGSGALGIQDFAVIRLTPQGAFDSTFGTDGVARMDFGGDEYGTEIGLLADGRIVASGQVTDDANVTRIGVVRLTAQGALDPTFGTDGRVVMGTTEQQYASDLLVEPAGRIVLGGYRYDSSEGTYRMVLVRLEADGTLDTGFGTGSSANAAALGFLVGLVQDAEGRFYVTDSRRNVLRFSAGGMIDESYSASLDGFPLLGDLAVDTQGRVVAAGYANVRGGVGSYAARLTSSGQLDSSFGSGGISRTRVWTRTFNPYQAWNLASGGAVVVGGFRQGQSEDIGIVRLTQTGGLDAAYSREGVARRSLSSILNDDVEAAAVTPDGTTTMLVSCSEVYDDSPQTCPAPHYLLRLTPGGSNDTNFGASGINGVNYVDFELGGDVDAYADQLVPLADGGFLLVGTIVTYDGSGYVGDGWLARFTATGQFDSSFGQNGMVRQSGGDVNFDEVAVLADGRLIVSGTLYDGNDLNDSFLARYTAAGQLDTSFGQNGVLTPNLAATCTTDDAGLAFLRPVGAGFEALRYEDCEDEETFKLAATRFDADAQLVGTEVVYDEAALRILTASDTQALVWKEDHTLVWVDARTERVGFEARDVFALTRFGANGALDSSFGADGTSTFTLDGLSGGDDVYAYFSDITPQPDGSLLLVGQIEYYPDEQFGLTTSYVSGYELLTVSVDANGAVTTDAAPDLRLDAPTVQVVPNPTSGDARIHLTSNGAGAARVSVFDLLGREVARLLDTPIAPGPLVLSWDSSSLPSGAYIVRFETAAGVAQKMVHHIR